MTETTMMAAAYAAAETAKSSPKKGKNGGNLASAPLQVNLGGTFDPDAFVASMAEVQRAQARQTEELAGMSARAGQFDQLLAKIPLAAWTTCVKQEPFRKQLRAVSRDGAEAFRSQLQMLEQKLDAELGKLFGGEVGNLLPAEKEQVGVVAKMAWLVYQLETAPAQPTKGYIEWLLKRGTELGIVAELKGGEVPKGGSLVRYGKARQFCFSAHVAERHVLESLRQYAAASPENAATLGIPADPKRVVGSLITVINTMMAARNDDIAKRLDALRDGVDRALTVKDLERGVAADYLIVCPEERRNAFTHYQVTARINSDGDTVSFVGAFGGGAREVEKFMNGGITVPLATIFSEKPPVGAKGPAFGAWATLRRGVIAEQEKLVKREQGERLREEELALCKKAAKDIGSPMSDGDFAEGKIGVAVIGFRGLFKYQAKVPGKDGARSTSRDMRVWNPVILVERSLDKDEHPRITLRFTPERTTRMFEGAMNVPYTENGDNDRPFSGVGHTTLQVFLRASTSRSRKGIEAEPTTTADESISGENEE